jgi:hypothetical protein
MLKSMSIEVLERAEILWMYLERANKFQLIMNQIRQFVSFRWSTSQIKNNDRNNYIDSGE